MSGGIFSKRFDLLFIHKFFPDVFVLLQAGSVLLDGGEPVQRKLYGTWKPQQASAGRAEHGVGPAWQR